MSMKVFVNGVKQAGKYLIGKRLAIVTLTDEGVRKATVFLHGEVKQSIAGRRSEPQSVDTGRFLNSVGFTTSKFNGVVYSNVSYSKYLEYGTSRMKARRHFQNSKSRNKGKIKDYLFNEIKKV